MFLAFIEKSEILGCGHFILSFLAVAWFDLPDAFSRALLPGRLRLTKSNSENARCSSPASLEAVDLGLCHLEELRALAKVFFPLLEEASSRLKSAFASN